MESKLLGAKFLVMHREIRGEMTETNVPNLVKIQKEAVVVFEDRDVERAPKRASFCT